MAFLPFAISARIAQPKAYFERTRAERAGSVLARAESLFERHEKVALLALTVTLGPSLSF
jgi:hypothetical protein